MSTKRKAARRKPPRDPKKLYPGEFDAETEADIDRRMMAEYHRSYLRSWYCDAMHLIAHLRREAEQLAQAAGRDPGGAIAAMGAGELGLYSSALDNAHLALGKMLPPTATTPVVLQNVARDLDELWRRKPWKGRDE